MADLSNVVRMLIHRLDATRSYLLPGYCDEDEKARAVIAFAESALAAEPPAPAEPDTDAVLALAAIIRQVDGSHSLGAAALAEAILSHPGVAFSVLPPAPAPADHVPDAGNMVEADEEWEELAQWLERIGDDYDDLYRSPSALIRPKLARAAAMLREARPQPVPVVDRPWERPGWCDAEGRCWWGRCADDFFNPEWTMATLASIEEFCSDSMPQHCLPHWAIAIPQPPQANTTHPTPTEPPTDD